jgi:general secretion pathway protein B
LTALAALVLAGWFARGLWNAPLSSAAAEPALTRVDVSPAQPHEAAEAAALTTADAEPPVRMAIAPPPVPVQPAVAAAPASPAQMPPTRPVPMPTVAEVRQAARGSLPEDISVATPAPESNSSPAQSNTSTMENAYPLRLADLSSEERRQLPTLKMSMHLWDAESSKRFVILDGERMGEGDRIGDAVIEEITRDGVLLAWQGRSLKLPIQ